MQEIAPLKPELRDLFRRELTASEKIFFLKKADEAIFDKRYQPGEDLFHYCYFLTLKERLRTVSPDAGDGYLRYFLVETKRDVEDSARLYQERLELTKLPKPDAATGQRFIMALERE